MSSSKAKARRWSRSGFWLKGLSVGLLLLLVADAAVTPINSLYLQEK